jgi:hypothetical protein
MRLIAAFVAAVTTAAIAFALEFVIEGFFLGVRMSTGEVYLIVALNLIIGFPVALFGGVPIWLALRSHRMRTPWAFGLSGAALGLATYLLLIAMGMSAPSDHPMSFSQNISRLLHVPRIAAAICAGGIGGTVFWSITMASPRRSDIL